MYGATGRRSPDLQPRPGKPGPPLTPRIALALRLPPGVRYADKAGFYRVYSMAALGQPINIPNPSIGFTMLNLRTTVHQSRKSL